MRVCCCRKPQSLHFNKMCKCSGFKPGWFLHGQHSKPGFLWRLMIPKKNSNIAVENPLTMSRNWNDLGLLKRDFMQKKSISLHFWTPCSHVLWGKKKYLWETSESLWNFSFSVRSRSGIGNCSFYQRGSTGKSLEANSGNLYSLKEINLELVFEKIKFSSYT